MFKYIRYYLYLLISFFRIPYSQAYINIQAHEVKNILINKISEKKINMFLIKKLYQKHYDFLIYCKKIKVDMPEVYFWTALAALTIGNYEDWKTLRLKLLEKQKTISDKKKLNFQIIEPGHIVFTIGNTLTLDAWIKSQILGFSKKIRTILPLPPQYKNKIINRSMLEYYKPFIDIIEDPKEARYYYSNLQNAQAWHNIRIPCGKKHRPYFSHSSAVYVQSVWDSQKRKPLFSLRDSHRFNGRQILKKMGIPEDSWFVTCHVREPHFKHREDFRDSDIATYFDAFKEITDRGGWVVRMGDKSMSPLPKMNRVIDYAISEFKSDWMDIFLLADAKFILGCSSGPTTVAYAFGTPIVMTNNLPTAGTYLSKRDLFMPRLMQRLDNGKMISLVDSMTIPYSLGFSDSIYKNIFKVKTIPNNNIEIKNITIEMLERLDGSIKYSSADENLQSEFKKKTAEKEVMIGFPGFPIQCRLGNYFLQNYYNHI